MASLAVGRRPDHGDVADPGEQLLEARGGRRHGRRRAPRGSVTLPRLQPDRRAGAGARSARRGSPHCRAPGCPAPANRSGTSGRTAPGSKPTPSSVTSRTTLPPLSRTTTDSAAARAWRRVLRTASWATRHTSATVSPVAARPPLTSTRRPDPGGLRRGRCRSWRAAARESARQSGRVDLHQQRAQRPQAAAQRVLGLEQGVALGAGRRPGPGRRGRRWSRRGPARPRRAGRVRSAGARRPTRWRRCAAAARARRRPG